ncbi:MAG TPA: hypothetical protein VGH98_04455 [Gemmatimonadaceae bacterium]|jgi:hypothetical protein
MSTDAVEALSFFFGVAAVAWAAAFAWAKWLKHRYDGEKRSVPAPAVDAERLARLETAVETLAVELERIGEAQRYTVKVLEERLPRAIPAGRQGQAPEGGRIVTPH